MAHPANFIYAKKYLDVDPHYYKTQTVGSGPFKLKNYVRGSLIELGATPVLAARAALSGGHKYFIIRDDSARAGAPAPAVSMWSCAIRPRQKPTPSKRSWTTRWWWPLPGPLPRMGSYQCGQEAL